MGLPVFEEGSLTCKSCWLAARTLWGSFKRLTACLRTCTGRSMPNGLTFHRAADCPVFASAGTLSGCILCMGTKPSTTMRICVGCCGDVVTCEDRIGCTFSSQRQAHDPADPSRGLRAVKQTSFGVEELADCVQISMRCAYGKFDLQLYWFL